MGNVRMNTLFTGVAELFVQGLWDMALLVLLTSIIFPVLKMVLLLYTLTGISIGRLFPGTGSVFRWYHYLQEWAMVDVFVLGVMVALTKLDSFADVSLGLGFWSLCVMLTLSTFASFFLNVDLAWREIERLA
jgi:paraquat-inducible protein A